MERAALLPSPNEEHQQKYEIDDEDTRTPRLSDTGTWPLLYVGSMVRSGINTPGAPLKSTISGMGLEEM